MEITHKYIDPKDGTVYYEYAFSYTFKDKNWDFSLWATSEEEAREKLNSIYYAKCDGVIEYKVEVPADLPSLWGWVKSKLPFRLG